MTTFKHNKHYIQSEIGSLLFYLLLIGIAMLIILWFTGCKTISASTNTTATLPAPYHQAPMHLPLPPGVPQPK